MAADLKRRLAAVVGNIDDHGGTVGKLEVDLAQGAKIEDLRHLRAKGQRAGHRRRCKPRALRAYGEQRGGSRGERMGIGHRDRRPLDRRDRRACPGDAFDRRRHHIRAADEIRDKPRGRPFVDFAGPADLLDRAAVHHRDAIGHGKRFALVVRHEHCRDGEAALKCGDLRAHVLPQLEVEVAERLVEQQDRRPDDQRACERHALALAAGKLERPPPAQAGELDEVERLLDAGVDLPPIDPPHPQTEGDVLRHGHVREQRIVLEDHADIAREGLQVLDMPPLEVDLAGVRREEPGDQPERRRLAASRRSEQGDELALRDGQVERAHGGDDAEALLDALEQQRRFSHAYPHR